MNNEIDRKIKELDQHRKLNRYLCHAPFVSIKISGDGLVSPCCYNVTLNEYYAGNSIKSIWTGDVFNEYRRIIKNNVFPKACEKCKVSMLNNEINSIKFLQFDKFKIPKFKKIYPQLIELSISNICNLECIMCSGAYSSSIRRNREKLPPIKNIFDSKFRKDFEVLIDGLKEVVFAGGEPFLIPSYFDLWEDLIRKNPYCELSVVTNGTVLNDKVIDIVNRGNFKINLSFDAITKETYEKIRINAVFEKAIENIRVFGELMRAKKRRLHIPICPLKMNRYEIPDLVRFCNENNYSLNFVTVFRNFSHSMRGLGSKDLISILEYYKIQDFNVLSNDCQENINQFKDLITGVEKWIEESKIRENFENIFDLSNNLVEELKGKFYAKIEQGLIQANYPKDEVVSKKEEIIVKFNSLMDILPNFFNSNHFYRKLLSYSDVAIVEVFLIYAMETLVEISNESFFFSSE